MASHNCEKRGCKVKNPEYLSRMSGAGFAKNEVDERWFCDDCFEEINGEKMREFQRNEALRSNDKDSDSVEAI